MPTCADIPIPNFPFEGLVPTDDTQASSFIQKHPNYDGRNTVVAILDTGIDPGAAGMQTTTDGKPKLIDIVDCTGSGDVHMSEDIPIEKQTDENQKEQLFVIGVSGKKLLISPNWNIPTGKVRVGLKMLYDLTPDTLTNSIKKDRKKIHMNKHKELVHKIRNQLLELEKSQPNKSDSEIVNKKKEELDAQLEALKSLESKYEDFGPELDCIVFHDGSNYRAVVNTTSGNDLSGLEPFADYKLERQYGVLLKSSLFNYSVKIYDEGKLLSIVTTAGSHGSHVAGISTGYHPDSPEMNGAAPGAQVISLKIGDHRLGSLEVGTGLTRASNSIIEHKADLANMSYGEATSIADNGQWIDLLKSHVIRRHLCIFVSSAGNEGPGLSTLGAPGGTTDDVIGVGAFVGHQQMRANYHMLKTVGETSYTWSSMGPSYDGARGATIYGPGSAVACYPEYTLKKYEMINGTSMSSPNVCGCLSLLVSGMKALGIRVTPYRVRRAIIQTGKDVGDILKVGFIQVEKAWNYLVEQKENNSLDVAYKSIIDSRKAARGIYYREINECSRLNVEDVTIVPKFLSEPELDDEGPAGDESRERVRRELYQFDKRLVLVSTKTWIKVPDCLYTNSTGRSFRLSVDCKSLEAGKFHFGEIQAFDTDNIESGAVFTIPVAVAKPVTVDYSAEIVYKNLSFKPVELKRMYIHVPLSANKMNVTITSKNTSASAPANFVINACQLLLGERFTLYEYQRYFKIAQGSYISGEDGTQTEKHHIDVQGGVTLELVIGQFWSQFDCHDIDLKLEFNGLQIQSASTNSSGLFIDGNNPSTKVTVVSHLRSTDKVTPKISFKTTKRPILPQKSEIITLSNERDVLPNKSRVYGLLLTYKVTLKKGKVRVSFPACDNYIYDSWFEDKMLQIFNANKMRLGVYSVYPKAIDISNNGDYYLQVLVRHENVSEIEKLKNSPVFINMDITPISPTISKSFSGAVVGSNGNISSANVSKGESLSFYIGGLKPDSLGNIVNPGDLLEGTLSFGHQTLRSFNVQCLAPLKSKPKTNSGAHHDSSTPKEDVKVEKTPEDNKSPPGQQAPAEEPKNNNEVDKMNKAITEMKIKWISKIKDKEAQNKLIDELTKENPENYKLFEEIMRLHDPNPEKGFNFLSLKQSDIKIQEICESSLNLLSSATKIIDGMDMKTLALQTKGSKRKNASKAETEAREEHEKNKKILVAALLRKCRALISIYYAKQLSQNLANTNQLSEKDGKTIVADPNVSKLPEVTEENINAAIDEYEKWAVDDTKSDSKKKALTGNPEYMYVVTGKEYISKNLGKALLNINKYLSDLELTDSNLEKYRNAWDCKVKIIEELGWESWVENYESNKYFIFSKDFAKF
ncbi:hypothetical protein BB558_001358 [Smittium angustum]|uniref:tripeptidyl-peptidase II n=1 Tax=Smittium angustum TaxID=133377 RepID=A0A2U1JBX4_SMIAN|nr:hypothetical protein BB558_003898 [Smittium angustum]PWA02535.1 hypothetical protein BB558_001358 [Smittium angustum]